MMENEPPTHTPAAALVAAAFGRGHVERMRPRIEALAAEMVGALGEPFDVLGDYAEPMPVYVIADLLGVPREDHASLRAWSQAIVHMYEPDVGASPRGPRPWPHGALRRLRPRRHRAPARRARATDLITDLLAARDADTALQRRRARRLGRAAAQRRARGVGQRLRQRHPRAAVRTPTSWQRITSGEVSVETALEELIRFDAPLQLFERTATADVEIAGQLVAAGEKVACLMGSANRDAAVFEHADTLDVGRDPNPHVGFGMGRHFCLGAPLARLELQISLTTLLDRSPPRARRRGAAPPHLGAARVREHRGRACMTPEVARHDEHSIRTERLRRREVIAAKRDRHELSDAADRLGRRRLHARRRRRRADVGARDGDPAQRHGPPRDRPLDRRDDRQRRADGLLVAVVADRRQALDRRRRRQDHPAARTARRGVRRRGAAAVRPRAGPHRRHARQARGHPRLARRAAATTR